MIDPSAAVHESVTVPASVSIGAFAVVEADVTIGENCTIAAHAVLRSGSDLGANVTICSFAVIAGQPQMRGGGPSTGRVRIGARSMLREGVTVNLPTKPGGLTVLGDDCMLMANSHVGHDCVVGNNVTLANNVMLAGHVHVGDGTFLGGGAGVHQFVRIGNGVMVGGNAAISYDVPPYVIAAERNQIHGLIVVGLRRSHMPSASVADLKRCYHAVYAGPGDLRSRVASLLAEVRCGAEAPGQSFLQFFAGGKRGFCRPRDRSAPGDRAAIEG